MARTYFGYGCCCGGSGSRPEIGGSGPIWVECLQTWIPRLLFLRAKDALGRWAWSEECWPEGAGNLCAEFFEQTFEMHYIGDGKWRAAYSSPEGELDPDCVLDVTMHTGTYLHRSGSYVECVQLTGTLKGAGYDGINYGMDDFLVAESISLVPFAIEFHTPHDTCAGHYYISEEA